jgi:RNA polymerase sigma factor (TIGR02999 family)
MPEPENISKENAASTPEERQAIDDLFGLMYPELRRIAAFVRSNEMHSTLSPTALVNEAWLRLKNSPQLASLSHPHFRAIAARAMRQVLVDAARHRNAWGGKDAQPVTLDESVEGAAVCAADLLTINEALDRLAEVDAMHAEIVQLKFFAGLTDSETAEELGVSKTKVERSWRAARAWLNAQLRPAYPSDNPPQPC